MTITLQVRDGLTGSQLRGTSKQGSSVTRYGDTGDRTLDESGIVRQREMLRDV